MNTSKHLAESPRSGGPRYGRPRRKGGKVAGLHESCPPGAQRLTPEGDQDYTRLSAEDQKFLRLARRLGLWA